MVLGFTTIAWSTPYLGADITQFGTAHTAISGVGKTPRSGGHEWYTSGTSIWTTWANQWVEYSANLTKAGTYTVKYTWFNDQYAPSSGLDANIEIASVFFDDVKTAPVPEPATMVLFGLGLLGLAGIGRKKMS